MSERSEAAQKWANAKEIMEGTQLTLEAAHTAHNDAVRAEAEAWEALQALAGRKLPEAEILNEEILYVSGSSGGNGEPTRPHYTHSLKQHPIGK